LDVVSGFVALPKTVGIQTPSGRFLAERKVENLIEVSDVIRLHDSHQSLNATVKVAVHHVGRTNEVFWLTAVGKSENSRMLKVSTKHAAHTDGFAESRDSRPQSTHSTDQNFYRHTRLTGSVQRVDNLFVNQ
jgi:hypothetical protein